MRLVVALAVALSASVPAEAGWGKNCALALALASPLAWNAVDPPAPLSPRQAAYEAQLHENVGLDLLSHFYGPGRVGLGLVGRRQAGHSIPSAFETTVRNDSKYLLGYFGLLLGLRGVYRRYFSLPFREYQAAVDERLGRTPDRVLFLNGFKRDTFDDVFHRNVFWNRYGDHPDAVEDRFENLEDLVATLCAFAEDGEVDRLEIGVHGHPGKLEFADGSVAAVEAVERALAAGPIRLMRAGGEIVFFSCSLGNGDRGDRLLAAFGRHLLPKGGRLLAATKHIVMRRRAPSLPEPVVAAIVHGMGLGNHELLLGILGSLWRDYADAVKDAKLVVVERREP